MVKIGRMAASAPIALAVCLLAQGTASGAGASAIHMSQIGYATGEAKSAIIETTASRPVAWSVIAGDGRVAARGRTSPLGMNSGSGKAVHRIDMPADLPASPEYRLRAGAVTSRPFAVSDRPWQPVAKAALAFFYHNRSGIVIEPALAGAAWARPAGHAPDIGRCFRGPDKQGTLWAGCSYAVDGTGGWYDAGDHGKYVVNGGISVWTLQYAWERALVRGGSAAFADGTAQIPERADGKPDLLNEARWQLEFMLKMQAPLGAKATVPVGPHGAGNALPAMREIDAGGMVHHKLASRVWTPLPQMPHADANPRILYPPSTAATLNLAASAAQAARLWRTLDPDFAAWCLEAAEAALAAALRNPEVYAPDVFDGSGSYGDGDVRDEFHWAATELAITTGKAEHRATAARFAPQGRDGDIGWNSVSALGALSDLLHEGAPKAAAQTRLIAMADHYLALAARQPYGLPHRDDVYFWGSSGQVANNAMVLLAAHDATNRKGYRDGAVAAMDWLMGRNPNDVSFVSGFGARAMRTPHHRHWAKGADPAYPEAPPGALSGGPNSSGGGDPVLTRLLAARCKPQLCWADDVQAYALNEVAVNWNAPLVLVASALDEMSAPRTAPRTAR